MATGREIDPLMESAIRNGFSFAAFFRSAREHGYKTYRRADMLETWSSKKEDFANETAIAGKVSKEYPELVEKHLTTVTDREKFYYKARVDLKALAGLAKTEQRVTIISEKPLTIGEIMEQIQKKWPSYEYGRREQIAKITPFAAWHVTP